MAAIANEAGMENMDNMDNENFGHIATSYNASGMAFVPTIFLASLDGMLFFANVSSLASNATIH